MLDLPQTALREAEAARHLAMRWAKGAAILFAVGAVSGTVLSFELGLLWPRFMELAGPLIGMPFSLEGVAFFTEAIFLGVYLYGWDRMPARAHFASGVMVAVSGLASGIFVVAVNGVQVGSFAPGTTVDVQPGDTITYAINYNLTTGDYQSLAETAFMPLPIISATGTFRPRAAPIRSASFTSPMPIPFG